MQFVELDRFFCSKHTSDTGKCSEIVSKVKRNRYFRFGDYGKTPKNARVGWGLVESQKEPGGSIFRSPAHLDHHRRCFIRFSQARQLCNTSNFRQKALDPGSESSRRTPKIKKIKNCQNNPNSIPNAFLWSLMNTSDILKQFRESSARPGPVFCSISRFRIQP